ncbi:MAG: phenylalanine-4-hydroxylase [Bacteroidetes bacterium]|nr:MAG: phenylalanine-4-hydroxylase [Bacteroidota bacterium]
MDNDLEKAQDFNSYTSAQHSTWNFLYERQKANLQGKASRLNLRTLDEMSSSLTSKTIPNVADMVNQLSDKTGWSLEIVPGLIPPSDFFRLLSQKKFCTSTWVRRQDQVDYIEEPDMFHDTFGHVPPLMDCDFASFMHRFGEVGAALSADGRDHQVTMLQRLYWFFVEFGFIREEGEAKLFGAGIMSSFGETKHAWDLRDNLKVFDLEEVMATPFRTDVIQDFYFILNDIPQLEQDLNSWFEKTY